MSSLLLGRWAPFSKRRGAHLSLPIWTATALMVCLPTGIARAQPSTQPTERIANTAQAVPETPADTVVAHRQSALRARHGKAGDGEVLPAREESRGKSLWLGDGWYVTGLVSLTAVLALIFLLGYLAKRFVLPGTRLGNRELEVLARTYVGPKQSIAIVKAGRRLMVVGVTANQVSLLISLDDPVEAAELMGHLAARQPGSISSRFSKRLEDEEQAFEEGAGGELPYEDERPEFAWRTRQQLRTAIERMRRFGRHAGVPQAALRSGPAKPRQRAAG